MTNSLDAVNYITGYATKHDTGNKESLLRDLNNDLINNSDVFRICLDMLRKREMGMMEIVDNLMGHSLYRKNSACVFINTNSENERQRLLKSKTELEAAHAQNQTDEKAYVDNWNDQFYPQRPAVLENHSLFNLRVYFKKVGSGSASDENEDEQEVC